MALAHYEQYAIKLDGVLRADNTQLNFNWIGQDQDVETTVKGFAGQSSSPRKLQIDVTEAIIGDDDTDAYVGRFVAGATVEVEVIALISNKKLKTTAFIREPKTAAGVGRTSEFSYTLMCEPTNWE